MHCIKFIKRRPHGTFQGLECVVLDEYLVEKPQNNEEKTKEKGQQVFNLFVLHLVEIERFVSRVSVKILAPRKNKNTTHVHTKVKKTIRE